MRLLLSEGTSRRIDQTPIWRALFHTRATLALSEEIDRSETPSGGHAAMISASSACAMGAFRGVGKAGPGGSAPGAGRFGCISP